MADALARLRELREHFRDIFAKPGRSVSDRPPASESPGPLAALLREVALAVRSLACSERPDLVDRIDAALRESSAERGGEER
jgi:hypothetical protein